MGRVKEILQKGSTVESCFDGGKSMIEELYNEMEEWAGNMEGTNLESTPKYESVAEVRDQLEEAFNYLEEIEEIPFRDRPCAYIQTVVRRSPRWARLATAVSQLEAVLDILDDEDLDEEEKESIPESIRSAIDAVDGIEFPGMFG